MLVNSDTKIYNGETLINKIYQGTEVIYESVSPMPYTQLEYLQSNGQQYIDTGYVYTSNKAKIKAKFLHMSGTRAVFGYYTNYQYYKTVFSAHGLKYYLSNQNPTNMTYSFNVVYEVEANVEGNAEKTGTYEVYSNGSLLGSGSGVGIFPDSTTNNTMLLFAQQSPQYGFDRGGSSRIYYFQMWDNDVMVRDFIPVLDDNNVPCMYDKITKTCFYNKGTGSFIYKTLN